MKFLSVSLTMVGLSAQQATAVTWFVNARHKEILK
jgi:hypothetical protein